MHIVVVGAGIAGLVAAGAAHRAGHRVTALERSALGRPRAPASRCGAMHFVHLMRSLRRSPRASARGRATRPATPSRGAWGSVSGPSAVRRGRVRRPESGPRPGAGWFGHPWVSAVSSARAARSPSCIAPTCSAC